jgi:hypothetical protein
LSIVPIHAGGGDDDHCTRLPEAAVMKDIDNRLDGIVKFLTILVV